MRYFKIHCGYVLALAFLIPPLTGGQASADVVISSNATANMSCAAGVCAPSAAHAVLNVSDLQNLLASGNLEVTTTGSAQAKDIRVADAFSWASNSTLTLDAHRSIAINKAVTVSGQGGVVLTTNDGGSGGALSFGPKGNITFWNLASSLTIDGAAYTLVGDIAALASDISSDASGDFALAADYNAESDGTYRTPPIATAFSGTFEGLGHKISHLKINDAVDTNVGFFAEIGSGGVVRDIGLTTATVLGTATGITVGILAGANLGTVWSTYSSGTVAGKTGSAVGGLIGDNEGGTVARSHSSAAASGSSAGGLAGANDGQISEAYASGSVSVKYFGVAGGLVGDSEDPGTINNCYATGSESGGKNSSVGGFVGNNFGTIGTSYSTGIPTAIHAKQTHVGGFVGMDSANDNGTTNSYWDTTTSGTFQGVGFGSTAGIEGLTTQDLQSGLPSGFDPAIWAENPSINGGLPYLIANPPAK